MNWILKLILLYPCDGEICSPVYLALQFIVMQLFCYFYVSTWIKKNTVWLGLFTRSLRDRAYRHVHAHGFKLDNCVCIGTKIFINESLSYWNIKRLKFRNFICFFYFKKDLKGYASGWVLHFLFKVRLWQKGMRCSDHNKTTKWKQRRSQNELVCIVRWIIV